MSSFDDRYDNERYTSQSDTEVPQTATAGREGQMLFLLLIGAVIGTVVGSVAKSATESLPIASAVATIAMFAVFMVAGAASGDFKREEGVYRSPYILAFLAIASFLVTLVGLGIVSLADPVINYLAR